MCDSSVAQHFRYASRKYWYQIVRDIPRPPRQRPRKRFVEFTATWDVQYPAILRLWENAWSEFVPFLDYGGFFSAE